MAETQRSKGSERWRSKQPLPERRSGRERRQTNQAVTADQRRAVRRGGDRRARVFARIRLGVDYLFFLLYALLALRLVLALVGANRQAGFVQFIRGATAPFYGPFSNIVESPAVNGGQLDLPALIALFTYALLHLAVRKLLRVIAGPAAPVGTPGP